MMNTQRFIFERATAQDSAAILAILEEAAFHGPIALLYTRRPDACRSFLLEAGDVDLVVARDTHNGQVAGVGACAMRPLFVNGAAVNVGYLFGLRIATKYRKKFPALHKGYAYLHALLREKKLACYLTTILEDNRAAQRLLEKPRRFMPTYHPFGRYEVFAFKAGATRRRHAATAAPLNFKQATADDLPQIADFLNAQGRAYQFFPVISADDLRAGRFPDLAPECFYLLRDQAGDIMASGALWNQESYKQYVVQGYSGILKTLYPLSRIFPLFGLPALPARKSILHFSTLSFWCVKDNDPRILRVFLERIAQQAAPDAFFLAGAHEAHPLRPVLQERRHISYASRLYVVAWDEQQPFFEQIARDRPPYLECGLL